MNYGIIDINSIIRGTGGNIDSNISPNTDKKDLTVVDSELGTLSDYHKENEILSNVEDFFKKASFNTPIITSEYKMLINKILLKIYNYFEDALYYIDLNYLHTINQIENALSEMEKLWKYRTAIDKKYSLYSQFVNLLQTQFKLIISEKITYEQLNTLKDIFENLTIDKLNKDLLIDITLKLSKQNFPLFKEIYE